MHNFNIFHGSAVNFISIASAQSTGKHLLDFEHEALGALKCEIVAGVGVRNCQNLHKAGHKVINLW